MKGKTGMVKITEKINAYNVDCIEFMKDVPDGFYDLAIIDCPYGIGEAGKNHESRGKLVKKLGGTIRKKASNYYTKKDWDNEPPSDEFFIELQRLSKNQIIFGANYFKQIHSTIEKPPRRNQYQEFFERYPKGYILWDKVNGDNDFSDCEVIYTSFDFNSFKFDFMWSGMMQAFSVSSGTVMIGDKKLNQKRFHPTEKPTAVYKYILSLFAVPKNKIIDTHGGSMSLAIACHDYGFELDVCELDKEYFDKAVERIKNHVSQLKMF